MVMKKDVSDTTQENKQIIANINKDKFRAMVLPLLCSLLMILEFTLHVFLSIDITIIVISTFILASIIHNNVTVQAFLNMDRAQAEGKGIHPVKVKWRSLLSEYIAVCLSCLICVSVLFFSLANKFL